MPTQILRPRKRSSGKVSVGDQCLFATQPFGLDTVERLVGMAIAVGARSVPKWSPSESAVARAAEKPSREELSAVLRSVSRGEDPLGSAYCTLHSAVHRRARGCTFTPGNVIEAMLNWCSTVVEPSTVIDPGTGSARFLVAAGRRFPRARLIGIELDPSTAILARGHLAAAGFADRATVIFQDFRSVSIDRLAGTGPKLFVGNPPYVRHHQISAEWKTRFVECGKQLGVRVSALAGLHIHFLFAIARVARKGDAVCMITAAEWLDVNYGSALRQLFLSHLGGEGLTLIDPGAFPFADAATTGAILTARPGRMPSAILIRRTRAIDSTDQLKTGRAVPREKLEVAAKWSCLGATPTVASRDFIELGEICRVHRGQVTGANSSWIVTGNVPRELARFCLPTITRAKELYDAGIELGAVGHLRRVLDLPVDLAALSEQERILVEVILKDIKKSGAHETYIARHRRPWWRVGLREPAPMLATYMARRVPAFVVNRAGARHLNIAHGLYPRVRLSWKALYALAASLREHTRLDYGRTYAGGLTKFEPREMERILVPRPGYLEHRAGSADD